LNNGVLIHPYFCYNFISSGARVEAAWESGTAIAKDILEHIE
jgi:predicted NAD/FAD-dependent oxidoreductase|tara:strand:+ start:490 stop:615 length:126 start_codon:yes stop_codon:yes gene_type:complete